MGAQVASFFVSRTSNLVHSNGTVSTQTMTPYNFSSNSLISDETHYSGQNSYIQRGFIIAGSYIFIVGMFFLIMQCVYKRYSEAHSRTVSTWKDIFTPSKWSDHGSAFGIKILVLFIFYEVFLVDSHASMGPFLAVYAVDSDLNFNPPESSNINRCFEYCCLRVYLVFCIMFDSVFLGQGHADA